MADLIRKILIGRYFSATADAPQNSIITAITAGGKPAFPGVPLRVTPNMRFVVQGRNLNAYNRFLIVSSDGHAYPILPKFSRDNKFDYLSFDVPNYGDDRFTFSLRLVSTQPGIFAFEIDNFDYAQETEEEKKDREKKSAAAAEEQSKAEAEQKNIKRDEFEKTQAAGLTAVGAAVGDIGAAAGAVLGGAAEGLAAAASPSVETSYFAKASAAADALADRSLDKPEDTSAMDKATNPIVHKWQGNNKDNIQGTGKNGVQPAAALKPTGFANGVNTVAAPASASPAPSSPSVAGVSDITGQAPVIRRAAPPQPQGVPAQTQTAQSPQQGEPSLRGEPLRQPAPTAPRFYPKNNAAASTGPVAAPSAGASARPSTGPGLSQQNQSAIGEIVRASDGTSAFTGAPYAGNSSIPGGSGGGVILTGSGTYKSPRSSARFDASGKLEDSVNVTAEASNRSSVGVQASLKDELSAEQRTTLHESSNIKQATNIGSSVSQSSSVAVAENIEESVEQGGTTATPISVTSPPAQPFKNRQTLALEKEFDAKYAASGTFKTNARDLDVKLKRPEGSVPFSIAVSLDRTGTSQPQPVERSENDEEEQVLENQQDEVEAGERDDQESDEGTVVEQESSARQPLRMAPPTISPSKGGGYGRPEGWSESGAGKEAPFRMAPPTISPGITAVPAAEAGEGAVAAGAAEGGALAAEGAVLGSAGVAAAGAKMMATKDGREKAIKGAANVVAGPESGIAISFFKKHWKLIVGLLTAVVVAVLGLVLVFLLTLTQWMCTHWATYGLIYLSGYKNVCASIQNVGTGNILPAGTTVGQLNTSPGSGQCTPVVAGPASVASLQSTCFGGNAQQASSISEAESGGNPASLSQSDKCADGNSVSVGLFQINLTNHPINGLNCPAAFSSQYTASNKTCIVVNQALYQSCVTAAETPAYNIAEACVISSNGASWTQWGSDSKCGF